MKKTTAEATINRLRHICSFECSPKVIITDSGPPFNSTEFKHFCQQWNLQHTTSSPNYPQSDGQVERSIQTVKQRMARCKQDAQDCQQALLELRSTPTKDPPSPAEILHGRPSHRVNGQVPASQVDMKQIKQKTRIKTATGSQTLQQETPSQRVTTISCHPEYTHPTQEW